MQVCKSHYPHQILQMILICKGMRPVGTGRILFYSKIIATLWIIEKKRLILLNSNLKQFLGP